MIRQQWVKALRNKIEERMHFDFSFGKNLISAFSRVSDSVVRGAFSRTPPSLRQSCAPGPTTAGDVDLCQVGTVERHTG